VPASSDPRLIVGLIGLGNMGAAIAERLLGAGYALVVYNRTAEKARAVEAKGAEVADSPRDLARQADVIFTSVADDRALEDVAGDALPGARPGTILVDLSTVSPAASSRVGRLAEQASVGYLRAPVSGNPTVVRAGNLTVIVSGPPETYERAEELIRAVGPTLYYVGEREEARVLKLALNLMVAGLAELMSEALVLGEAAGISRANVLEVMGSSAVGAPFVKYKTEPLLRDDFSATFTTTLMEKDIDLVLAIAEDAQLELPLGRKMKELLRAAAEDGYADLDFIALFLQLRNARGAELSAAGARPDQEVAR
jgi:3-hydroxyisobutyrate dehydrogenase-like beta-hydroxyacid dehydrogenase